MLLHSPRPATRSMRSHSRPMAQTAQETARQHLRPSPPPMLLRRQRQRYCCHRCPNHHRHRLRKPSRRRPRPGQHPHRLCSRRRRRRRRRRRVRRRVRRRDRRPKTAVSWALDGQRPDRRRALCRPRCHSQPWRTRTRRARCLSPLARVRPYRRRLCSHRRRLCSRHCLCNRHRLCSRHRRRHARDETRLRPRPRHQPHSLRTDPRHLQYFKRAWCPWYQMCR